MGGPACTVAEPTLISDHQNFFSEKGPEILTTDQLGAILRRTVAEFLFWQDFSWERPRISDQLIGDLISILLWERPRILIESVLSIFFWQDFSPGNGPEKSWQPTYESIIFLPCISNHQDNFLARPPKNSYDQKDQRFVLPAALTAKPSTAHDASPCLRHFISQSTACPPYSPVASNKSDNFASASDRSGSGAAPSASDNFVSASDRSGSGAAPSMASDNRQCIWWHQHQMQPWLFHQISHQHLNQAHLLRLSKWSFQRLSKWSFQRPSKRSFRTAISCTLNESN